MKKLKEIQELISTPKHGATIEAAELRLLIESHEWSLLWCAFAFVEFRGGDFGVLMKLQQYIRFPECDPVNASRLYQAPINSNLQVLKLIWQKHIIPYLSFSDQLHLGEVSKYFFNLSSALYELKNEFPAHFKGLLLKNVVIDPQDQLSLLRALAYPELLEYLRGIFVGIVKNISSSEFLQLASVQSLRQWVIEKRRGDDTLSIEQYSPLTLSIKLDRLTAVLFFLSCLEHRTSQYMNQILKDCCQYGAATTLQFFLWAFSNDDHLSFDPYLSVACEYRMINIVKLLAPRVKDITLTMCLVTIETDPKSANIVECLKAHGASIPEEVKHFHPQHACYSDLIT